MSKILYRLLAVLFFAPYFGAYAISYALRLPGRENMPTIKEWFLIEE